MQLDERTDDVDAHFHGPRAIENRGDLNIAMFCECGGQLPAAAPT